MLDPVPLEERWWNEGEIDASLEGSQKQKPKVTRRRKRRVSSVVQADDSDDSSGRDGEEHAFRINAEDVQPFLMDEAVAAEDWPGLAPCDVPNNPRARLAYLKALAGDSDSFSHLLKISYSTLVRMSQPFRTI